MSKKIQSIFDESYFIYAQSVIYDRALPDIRDGLKPVQRRILYSMWDHNIRDKYKKSARVVGNVVGSLHPHGDSSVYLALVRMAQPFMQSLTLIDGQGNFGSADGYPAAAMRYTECRLTNYSYEFFSDLNCVPTQPNYDGTEFEPQYLPSKLPNLLINGSYGIAVGVATSIPPHNILEILNSLIAIINNPEITLDEIIEKHFFGPDFPTNGTYYGKEKLKEIYETGEGSVILTGNYKIEDNKIIFYEIPYGKSKLDIINEINLAINNGKIEMVRQVKDESDRKNGISLVIYLKSGANTDIAVNQILECTSLKSSYRICLFALKDGISKVYSLMEYLHEFINFRIHIVQTRKYNEKEKLKKRMHLLIGLLIALENIDEIIKGINNSSNYTESESFLRDNMWKCQKISEYLQSINVPHHKEYSLSDEQIKKILDLRIHNLNKLEKDKIVEEMNEIRNAIQYCNIVLESDEEKYKIIKDEFVELLDKYKNHTRRTKIDYSFEKKNSKDFIIPEDVIIILNEKNYIKKVSINNYRLQNRGGKGRSGSKSIKDVILANTHDNILFFSNHGTVYSKNVFEFPDGNHNTDGRAIVNFLPLVENEQIFKMFALSEDSESKSILFISKNGKLRRNNLSSFKNIRSNGKKYMEDDNQLLKVLLATDKDYILLATKNGYASCMLIDEFRTLNSRNSDGIKGCKLSKNDEVMDAIILNNPEDLILTITENGYGKISKLEDYRITHRGSKGVLNLKKNDKTGKVVSVCKVDKTDDIILMSESGNVIRIKLDNLKTSGRNTMGVRLCKLPTNDKITEVSLISNIEEEEE